MKAKFAFSLICLLSLGTFAFAQEFRASISGHVTDSTGASVPLAKVQATNLATKEASNATTDNSGSYSIPLLQPGVYKLTIQATGFRSERAAGESPGHQPCHQRSQQRDHRQLRELFHSAVAAWSVQAHHPGDRFRSEERRVGKER